MLLAEAALPGPDGWIDDLVLDPLLERDGNLPDELPDGVPDLAEVRGVHAAVVPRVPPGRRDGVPATRQRTAQSAEHRLS
ncbi:hypothetical protein [Geodermatophilus africanus]|uniref:hypothetical protein n=1 Tax=Geodermatophilus africanus TaxID=1137993 RepID=UPI00147BB9BC|nr:hypothetical protein [Geodermatophilus africanus]